MNTSYRPDLRHSRIVASAIAAWLARTQPQPQVTERMVIATETTVTRTVVAIERRRTQ